MADKYDVSVKVISQQGKCVNGHKVGDGWIIGGGKTPAGICLGAFTSLYPNARVLMFGGALPWATDPDMATVVCPDPKNPVIFELRRIKK